MCIITVANISLFMSKTNCASVNLYFCILLYNYISMFKKEKPLKFASKRLAKCSFRASWYFKKIWDPPALGAPNSGRTRGSLIQTYAPAFHLASIYMLNMNILGEVFEDEYAFFVVAHIQYLSSHPYRKRL
jgi:hypothetical protein